jgi:hypothetical protein
MKNNILILILCLFSACVSIKPAKNINKAENRIISFNKGIQNQIERFPSLVDKAYKITVRDTVFIPGYSAEFKQQLIKIDSLQKITENFNKVISDRNLVIDSLMNVPLQDYPAECQYIVDELKLRIKRLREELIYRQGETDKWFNNYYAVVSLRTEGFYEDEIFHVEYEYYKGDIIIRPSVKPSYKIVEYDKFTYDISIRKHFWQDFKFWGLMIIILNIFYFFNDLVYNSLKFIFTSIKSFIRKLFIKI